MRERYSFPEIFVGALLACAIFSLGAIFSHSFQASIDQRQPTQSPQKVDKKAAASSVIEPDPNERIADYTLALVLLTVVVAVATAGLWWIGVATGRRQLRAYITILSGKMEPQPLENGRVRLIGQITFKNCGQTPAYHVSFTGAIGIADEGNDPFATTQQLTNDSLTIVGPSIEHHLTRWLVISSEEAQAIHNGTKRAFLWGRIEYVDAFKARRFFEFQQTQRDWYSNQRGWSVGPYINETAN